MSAAVFSLDDFIFEDANLIEDFNHKDEQSKSLLDIDDEKLTATELKQKRAEKILKLNKDADDWLIKHGFSGEVTSISIQDRTPCGNLSLDVVAGVDGETLAELISTEDIALVPYTNGFVSKDTHTRNICSAYDQPEIEEMVEAIADPLAKRVLDFISGKTAGEIIKDQSLKSRDRIGQKLIKNTVEEIQEARQRGANQAECEEILVKRLGWLVED